MMKLRHILASLVVLSMLHGCGSCGADNNDDNNSNQQNADSGPTCDEFLSQDDGAGESCDFGDECPELECPCEDGWVVTAQCGNDGCFGREACSAACEGSGAGEYTCTESANNTNNGTNNSTTGPGDAVTDLTDAEKRRLCEELVAEFDGPADLECSTTEVRHVPGVNECIAKLDTFQPCASIEVLRDCFADFAQCDMMDRDRCWFFIGDDGGCSAPYLGFDRIPVALSVLPPVPANCDMPGPRQRIPFMISTNDVFPLLPGDIVNGLAVIPGITFDSGSFAVRRPRVSKLTERVCTSDAECGSGFKCATAGLPGAPRQCTRQSPVSFVPGSIRADFDPGVTEQNKQLVGVLIENTALLDGRLPTVAGELHDENGEKDLFADSARATDPTRVHRESIKNFLINLASVADPLNTAVTIFWYAGQVPAEARPLINERDLEDHFTNDLSIGEALIDAMPEPVPKPANLWQAIRSMIRKDYSLEKYEDHEKFLFIFTDGPNEVWDGVDDADGPATYEQTLADLQAEGIHVYIVQLDSEVDPSLIRDVPTYWQGNSNCVDDPECMGAPPCSSDAQCANFETCRQATVYGETSNDPPTLSAAQYCLPEYNDEGRLGPIDYYADLACRTGGNFMYVTEPNQMRSYWGALASTVDGQYSVELDFAALESSNFPDGWYRLSGVFLGIIGLRDLGQKLTAPISATDTDNRAILRMGN